MPRDLLIAFEGLTNEHQQRGIGAAFTAELLHEARGGITELTVLVASDNTAAGTLLRQALDRLEVRARGRSSRFARPSDHQANRARNPANFMTRDNFVLMSYRQVEPVAFAADSRARHSAAELGIAGKVRLLAARSALAELRGLPHHAGECAIFPLEPSPYFSPTLRVRRSSCTSWVPMSTRRRSASTAAFCARPSAPTAA